MPSSEETNSQVLDPNHVFYLHHSDNPHHVLTTQKLTDTNYYHWKRSVEISLGTKNKLNFVRGNYQKPVASSPLYSQWERCNNMVMAWLFHSVDKDIEETLVYCDTADQVWSDLQMRFGTPSCARIFQVQKELFTVSQGNLSVSAYFTKFKKLWDEYIVLVEMPSCSSCGTIGSVPQFLYNQQVVQFLVGLNDAYSLVRSNILMMKPTPHINETYQLVLQDEKQRELKSSFDVGGDSTVLNAYQKSGFGYGRGSSGNVRGGQSNYRGGGRGNDRRSMYFCDNCKIPGHSIERCFKIHGYPPRNDKDRTQNPRKDQQRGSAFNANGSTTRDDVQCEPLNSSSNFEPVLTKEQYSKLIALLSKNEISESVPDKASMMAGPFNEHISGSW